VRYDKGALRGLGGYGTLGLEIVLSILLGLFGGRWLDERYGTEPWLSVIGFVFGVAAAARAVQRTVSQMRRETEREEREQGNPEPLWTSPSDRARELAERRRQAEFEGSERTEVDEHDELPDDLHDELRDPSEGAARSDDAHATKKTP
jgi:ATP synthase protein I